MTRTITNMHTLPLSGVEWGGFAPMVGHLVPPQQHASVGWNSADWISSVTGSSSGSGGGAHLVAHAVTLSPHAATGGGPSIESTSHAGVLSGGVLHQSHGGSFPVLAPSSPHPVLSTGGSGGSGGSGNDFWSSLAPAPSLHAVAQPAQSHLVRQGEGIPSGVGGLGGAPGWALAEGMNRTAVTTIISNLERYHAEVSTLQQESTRSVRKLLDAWRGRDATQFEADFAHADRGSQQTLTLLNDVLKQLREQLQQQEAASAT